MEAADRIGIMGAVVGQDREVNNLSYQHHILGQSYNDKFAYKFLHMGMNLPRNFLCSPWLGFPFSYRSLERASSPPKISSK